MQLKPWQAEVERRGGVDQALKALGVDPFKAEMLASARAQGRTANLRGQAEHSLAWVSGLGMALLCASERPGDLPDALASTLKELAEQGAAESFKAQGEDLNQVAEQAISLALHLQSQTPPGELASSCAEGMLVGLIACQQSAVRDQRQVAPPTTN